ncbi:dihydroxyacetone kinase phosphoryl donor subunit DhaM [Corynebacterium sp. c25Ua_89]|uniref:dihydroxyacetone kinase phosphoryl donor subunit DhaM n=1 Tax=Corynebacterium sp. c25Ua_89 TaxID=3032356 RepID=UPI0039C237A3
MAEPKVGLVLVSHSAKLAEGLADLAGQMAADVRIAAAGGLESGEIGTSYDLIESAINDLLGEGLAVVVLTDLGSATMTVESVLEFLDDEPVKFVDAPLVEAAIAAATAAQQGDDLDEVATAAARAIEVFVPKQAKENSGDAAADSYERSATVADASGLHARPAAKIAEMAAEAEEDLLIAFDGEKADADSAMMLMSLGAAQGDTVTIIGDSVDKPIVDKIADAIAEGLDG